jgi:hypothetical protein
MRWLIYLLDQANQLNESVWFNVAPEFLLSQFVMIGLIN